MPPNETRRPRVAATCAAVGGCAPVCWKAPETTPVSSRWVVRMSCSGAHNSSRTRRSDRNSSEGASDRRPPPVARIQVLKTRGFAGDSRQASPVRPVYNADQPITALKGTGIRTLGPSRTNRSFLRNGKLAPENFTTTLCTTVATPNSVAQLLVDNPLFDWCRLAARPSLLRNRRNTSSSVGTFGLRPSRSA